MVAAKSVWNYSYVIINEKFTQISPPIFKHYQKNMMGNGIHRMIKLGRRVFVRPQNANF